MIFVALGRWSSAGGRWFTRKRIYWRGRWTPFVRVSWRYRNRKRYPDISASDRWQLAVMLNDLPDVCWLRLAMWAMYPENHEFDEVFSMRGSAGECERRGETPYCRKCGGSDE